MATVYLAVDLRHHRKVALKVLRPELAAAIGHERFLREITTTANLHHPHVLPVYDSGEGGGALFYVMPLVEGESLRTRLTREKQLRVEDALHIAKEVADGLSYAHARGVIHRDIKPENILLDSGHAVIADFGIAKALDVSGSEALTQTGVTLGTPQYMSPEQAAGGEDVDGRSDLYSLACVLYEMLGGQPPFTGPTVQSLVHQHLMVTAPPVTNLRPGVPLPVVAALQRALAKVAADRYQPIEQFVEALQLAPPVQPDRPSIAVLPFDNLSGDPEQEYFADGMVEEIITGLSRLRWLFVISRNSTFLYKGKRADPKTVGRDLGVRYVLQGSVRRAGNQVRVTGQLTDTETARNVWADRYEGVLGDLFRLQDELTMSVISAVEPTLRKAEIERVRRKRPGSLDAYDLFLRALPLASTAVAEDADEALQFLEGALRLEPNYPVVHGFIAWCHEQRYLRAGLKPEARQAALHHAHAAIETGNDDAMALAMGGFVVGILERDYETALEAIDRSLALSPSSALAYGFSSIIRVLRGDDSAAIEHARTGIRLGPYDPLIYLPFIGLSYACFFTGNFLEAASAASRASAANPRFSVPRYLHIVALVRLGRLDEAKAMAGVLLAVQPGFTISGLVSGNITTPERMALLAEALAQVGLPK
jgi:serine/threonine-protein kinase